MRKHGSAAPRTSASPDLVCSRTCLPANPPQWQSIFFRYHSRIRALLATDSVRALAAPLSWLLALTTAWPSALTQAPGSPSYENSSSSLSSSLAVFGSVSGPALEAVLG